MSGSGWEAAAQDLANSLDARDGILLLSVAMSVDGSRYREL